MKTLKTSIRHVFAGDADNRELAVVLMPIVTIGLMLLVMFGEHLK